jgi:hypothetical protein
VSVVHEFVLEDAPGMASKLERWFGRVSGRVGRDGVRAQFPVRWCYSCRDGQVVGRGVDSGRAHDPACEWSGGAVLAEEFRAQKAEDRVRRVVVRVRVPSSP